jgi:ribosome biogenesis protein NSA2
VAAVCRESAGVIFRSVCAAFRIAAHDERKNKHGNEDAIPAGAVPTYLLDREGVNRAKVLSNTVKQKRKEKAGKWDVPIPKVRPISDDEMFKVLQSGKRKRE